jgi:hypothetical protein
MSDVSYRFVLVLVRWQMPVPVAGRSNRSRIPAFASASSRNEAVRCGAMRADAECGMEAGMAYCVYARVYPKLSSQGAVKRAWAGR